MTKERLIENLGHPSVSPAAVAALGLILREYIRAVDLHPKGISSELEGWAVIHEEETELFDEIRTKHKTPGEHLSAVTDEAIHTGAMSLRFLVDLKLT